MHVMVVTYGEPKKGYLNFTLGNLWATQPMALLILPPLLCGCYGLVFGFWESYVCIVFDGVYDSCVQCVCVCVCVCVCAGTFYGTCVVFDF